MNYAKLDGPLAAACAELSDPERRNFLVFIYTDNEPDENQVAHLASLGVNVSKPVRSIMTGQLSINAIAELSALPWVKAIRLSQRLAPKSP